MLYPDPVDYITTIGLAGLLWSRYRTALRHTNRDFLTNSKQAGFYVFCFSNNKAIKRLTDSFSYALIIILPVCVVKLDRHNVNTFHSTSDWSLVATCPTSLRLLYPTHLHTG